MKNNTKNKSVLNKECAKVLRCIVKNAGLGATKIKSKLRWAFIPTRALGFLRTNNFVTVSENKQYNVSEAGSRILAQLGTPARRRKAKVKTEPVIVSEPAGELIAV